MWINLFVSLALAANPATSQPVEAENDFRRLANLELCPQGKLTKPERHQRAVVISQAMLDHYTNLKNLSFSARAMYYTVPLETALKGFVGSTEQWQPRERMRFTLSNQPGWLASQVWVKDQLLWSFYLRDNKLREFKSPWNGVPGKKTETSDITHAHLIEGVDEHLMCDLAVTFRPWVGPNPATPTAIKQRLIDGSKEGNDNGFEGLWLGQLDGADVIITRDKTSDANWDAFYIKDRLLVRRTMFVKMEESGNLAITDTTYSHFSTDEIGQKTFEPDEALTRRVATWLTLSEKEAMTEYRSVLDRKP